MVRQDLVEYIKDAEKKGYSDDQLKQHLISHNIPALDVEEAINQAHSPEKIDFPRTQSSYNTSQSLTQKPITFQSQSSIKHRNPFLVLLFSIITLGIYGIYWIISTNLELKKNTRSAPTPWILFILTMLAAIAIGTGIFFSSYMKIGIEDFQSALSTNVYTALIIEAIILLTSLVLTLYYWIKYAKALNELTGFSTVGAFLLMFFLFPIGIIVTQIQLNKKSMK